MGRAVIWTVMRVRRGIGNDGAGEEGSENEAEDLDHASGHARLEPVGTETSFWRRKE